MGLGIFLKQTPTLLFIFNFCCFFLSFYMFEGDHNIFKSGIIVSIILTFQYKPYEAEAAAHNPMPWSQIVFLSQSEQRPK